MTDRPAFPRHGGALAAASEVYGIPLADWLDLSTGINPLPYPVGDLDAADFRRLPDPSALRLLIEAARAAYAVPAHLAVAAVPGSDIALRLLPCLRAAGAVAIVSPTYSGHAEAWGAAGHLVHRAGSIESAARLAPVVVLANPNNPDGRVTPRERLLAIGREAAALDGEIIVDEAFADLLPEGSVLPALSGEPVTVLRSFGKFYGLAGLRLGFVIGQRAPIARMEALFGDWPLSGPAIAIGTRALSDLAWQAKMRATLAAAQLRLDAILAGHGLSIAGGTPLFRLVRTSSAVAMHEALARRGIWTRIFEDQPGFIRFGLPDEAGFERRVEVLRQGGG